MDGPEVRRLGPNWGRIALIVASVAVLVGAVLGVRAISAPVERAGAPTIPVPAPSGTRFLSPSASPSADASTSPSGSPSASASSSPRSTMKVSGDFDWAGVTAAAAGSQGELRRYAVGVESSAKLDADSVAKTVAGVLNDPRSWTGDGTVRFALVARAKATVNLYLASAKTAATLCGSDAGGADSCTKGNTVVISAERWKSGAAGYAGDTAGYRAYLVNHAVGQLLGKGTASCPGKGKKAPVMMQQSGDLRGCVANPWP
ncbi:MAG: DUF3152 domain-containing protein [Micropruina sp.]|uniref:DUF3152 domain-containing protein n=1 Tax=Micropruina sp. TaxID=2737536 RepID=UPI0039E21FE0